MIYFDYNATTPLDEEVLEAMLPYLRDIYGNPSSTYAFARRARQAIEQARQKVASFLGAYPDEIIFTSGGTESDNTAIKGAAFARLSQKGSVVTSSIEHHAVLNSVKSLEKFGFKCKYLNVDEFGIVDLEQLRDYLKSDTVLVSVMYANNEVGTIEPIKDIVRLCHDKGVYVHTDAVQAVGKIKIDVKELGVDFLSLSAHKLYGPKGVGVLYVKRGIKFEPLLHGGHHEKNRRASTENVAGIVGLGKAVDIAQSRMEDEERDIRALRDKLQNGILERIPEVKLNGHPDKRLYNTLSVCVKYIEGEGMLTYLDFEGICASSGSACTSGSLEPSHVLLAMGIPHEIAHGSLRFSLGKYNTESDINKVLEVFPPIVEKLRSMSPFWNKK